MNILPEHLDTLDLLMKEKGYDGHFSIKGAYNGELKECVRSYLNAVEQNVEPGPPLPCFLKTYSDRDENDGGPIIFSFYLHYTSIDGFFASAMKLRLYDGNSQLVNEREFRIQGNWRIPSCNQAAELIRKRPYRCSANGQVKLKS